MTMVHAHATSSTLSATGTATSPGDVVLDAKDTSNISATISSTTSATSYIATPPSGLPNRISGGRSVIP
jgi:hypothetical protein